MAPPRFSPTRRSASGRRWWSLAVLPLVALALLPRCSRDRAVHRAPATLLLTEASGVSWTLDAQALPSGARSQWALAPETSSTVQLPPGHYRFTQTLVGNGEARTVEVELRAGVSYRWPLASVLTVQERLEPSAPSAEDVPR